jgi:hypothetical protein
MVRSVGVDCFRVLVDGFGNISLLEGGIASGFELKFWKKLGNNAKTGGHVSQSDLTVFKIICSTLHSSSYLPRRQ